jgi:hypothetical protein
VWRRTADKKENERNYGVKFHHRFTRSLAKSSHGFRR